MFRAFFYVYHNNRIKFSPYICAKREDRLRLGSKNK